MDKAIKVGIISGIIASMVFVYFLDPILRIFGNFIVYSSNWVYAGLLDSLYQKAALGSPKDPALTIFSLISGSFVGVLSGILLAYFTKHHKSNEDDNRSILKTKVLLSAIAILAFLFMYQTWSLLYQYQIVTSFNQHMKILSPYLSEEQEEILISEYSCMSSEKDYDALYSKLDTVASKHNITLPKNPSYGFWAL